MKLHRSTPLRVNDKKSKINWTIVWNIIINNKEKLSKSKFSSYVKNKNIISRAATTCILYNKLGGMLWRCYIGDKSNTNIIMIIKLNELGYLSIGYFY